MFDEVEISGKWRGRRGKADEANQAEAMPTLLREGANRNKA